LEQKSQAGNLPVCANWPGSSGRRGQILPLLMNYQGGRTAIKFTHCTIEAAEIARKFGNTKLDQKGEFFAFIHSLLFVPVLFMNASHLLTRPASSPQITALVYKLCQPKTMQQA
jgi:hypothetical protein